MTRKHYRAIANAIATSSNKREIAVALADILAKDNERFDYRKFIEACNIMSVARTARRRRKQARQGFNHLAKIGRPIYPGPIGLADSKRREERFRAKLAALARRKSKK